MRRKQTLGWVAFAVRTARGVEQRIRNARQNGDRGEEIRLTQLRHQIDSGIEQLWQLASQAEDSVRS